MRRLTGFALSGTTGALYAALAPILALLLLQPTEYGLFSIPYLVFAFGVSLQYSIISEAWARQGVHGARSAAWPEYSSALATLSAIVGATAVLISLLFPDLRHSAILMGSAVFLAVYQNGARYYRVANGSLRRALLSDLMGTAAFVIALVLFAGQPPLVWIAIAWLSGGAAATVVLGLPRLVWGVGLVSWSRRHGSAIRPLLFDSLLMDAGAIGTPFLLAAFMGARDFGIYRAVSNVAMPVRLLVEPLRPALGRLAPQRLFSAWASLTILGTGLALAAACYLVLVYVIPGFNLQLGTLIALIPHALPTSLFVAGNLYGTVYYIGCRTNSTHRQIMFGRISQTVLVFLLPVVGFAIVGLSGAVWGFALSSLMSSVVWMAIARRGLANAIGE